MDLIDVVQLFGIRKLKRHAREFKASQPQRLDQAAPKQVDGLEVGEDSARRPFHLPITAFTGHGVISGATGAGKTICGLSLLEQLLRRNESAVLASFGVIDAKGDLWDRALALAGNSAAKLPSPLVINFAQTEPVPYALLLPQQGETIEQLVDRRMTVFDDIFNEDGQLSLRMSRALRNALLLVAEHGLAFPLVEFLLTHPDACRSLALRSSNRRVAAYFLTEFERERNVTVVALLARLDFVLRTEHIRLSFGADTFTDMRLAMDTGTPLLINTGGPAVPRQLARLIQSLLVSDLRQAVFARQERDRHYSWLLDEAQVLMSDEADTDNLTDLLTMARSFGTGLVLMTQSIASVAPDRAFINQLLTNVRWFVSFRCGMDDARLIESGLAARSGVVRQKNYAGRAVFTNASQERRAILDDIVALPNREAFVWVRGDDRPATRVRFPEMSFATGAEVLASLVSIDRRVIEQKLIDQEQQLKASVVPAEHRRRPSKKADAVMARLDDALRKGDRDKAR